MRCCATTAWNWASRTSWRWGDASAAGSCRLPKADGVGRRGDWLRHQVRQTEAPVDLWLLRGAVYSALGGDAVRRCQQRLDLHQALDSVFPDSSFTPMAPR